MRLPRALVLLLLVLPVPAVAADEFLTIHMADGHSHVFSVEVARNEAEREHGLMDRSTMPADHGMLFDFGIDRLVNMWMKDTLIPLDMVFIDNTGHITGIAQRTIPMSEAIIASPGIVRAVLELNGGTAERVGIAVGDRVDFPLFRP